MQAALPPGVILAGGLSRRMGGGDKALALLAGRPLLAHVAERLAPQCAGLAVNANGDPGRFAGSGLAVLPDGVAGWPGPLAGVLAAMDHAAAAGAEWVATAPADTPFLPRDLVARLAAASGPAGAVAASGSGGSRVLHPVCGLWPVARRQALRAALAAGLRRVTEWTAAEGMAAAVFPGGGEAFFNVNTPADLAAAEAMLARGEVA